MHHGSSTQSLGRTLANMQTAAARLPPQLSPATTKRSGSPRNLLALLAAHYRHRLPSDEEAHE